MAMNDDWRLRIDLHDEGFARRLSELLTATELEHGLERSFGERVVVSIDGAEVFCYAGTRSQAQSAEQLIRRLASEHGWTLDIELAHWHPTSGRWEGPDVPLPGGGAETEAERRERIAQERADSEQRGYPEWEVRVQCGARAQAGELSEALKREGIDNLHRWSYVLIGATDEDSANALADRVRRQGPSGATVAVERNPRAIYDDLPRSPFSVLGGLAG